MSGACRSPDTAPPQPAELNGRTHLQQIHVPEGRDYRTTSAHGAGMTSDDPRFWKALQFMGAHLRERATVSAIARYAGSSRATLYRLFQAAVGHPPHSFYVTLQMDRACTLLKTTGESIKAVASDVGFACRTGAFCRLFLRITGMTPSQYRIRTRDPIRISPLGAPVLESHPPAAHAGFEAPQEE